MHPHPDALPAATSPRPGTVAELSSARHAEFRAAAQHRSDIGPCVFGMTRKTHTTERRDTESLTLHCASVSGYRMRCGSVSDRTDAGGERPWWIKPDPTP
jgi:hypothetical protein